MGKLKKFSLVFITALIALLLVQCHVGSLSPITVGKKVWLKNPAAAWEKEVRHHISVGSSIASARELLEFNGFECAYVKDNDETENRWNPSRASGEGDYLSCSEEKSPWLACTESYQAYVRYVREKATEINAYVGQWCL
ncbi:MAG: hypothetical protein KME42_05070 [Tildeniella nuda ZEHNDER 1965/U140]|jgi:hypothetical protein|nr:hypothetical protein [Tildeniella nuda ZEHNDER 1965/U140]